MKGIGSEGKGLEGMGWDRKEREEIGRKGKRLEVKGRDWKIGRDWKEKEEIGRKRKRLEVKGWDLT